MKIGGNCGLMKPVSIIVAVDTHGGFGKDGKIPWNHKEDLKHFQTITKDAACVMGRQTYLDMYDMFVTRRTKNKKNIKKPSGIKEILPGRESYVVSKTIKDTEGAKIITGFRQAIEETKKDKIFILGGERLFIETLPWVNTIYMTLVLGTYDCDKFFPIEYVHQHFKIENVDKGSDSLIFIKYTRR